MSEHEDRVTAVTVAVRNVAQTWNLFWIERVVLFGSRARGDFRKESDIDLGLVYPDKDHEVVKESKANFSRSSRSYGVDPRSCKCCACTFFAVGRPRFIFQVFFNERYCRSCN